MPPPVTSGRSVFGGAGLRVRTPHGKRSEGVCVEGSEGVWVDWSEGVWAEGSEGVWSEGSDGVWAEGSDGVHVRCQTPVW